MSERVFGPGPTAWQIVENYSSYAELESTTIIDRAFGEQSAAVVAALSGVVVSVERAVLQYDAEFSFSAPASSTQQQD